MRNDCKPSMPDVMLQIVEQYGPEIIYQNERLIGLFRDFAPKLDRERRLLKSALDEDVAQSFKDCPADERGTRIQSAVEKLSQTMEKSDAELVVSSFTVALGWGEITHGESQKGVNTGCDTAQYASSSGTVTQSVSKQEQSDDVIIQGKTDDPHKLSENPSFMKIIKWGSIIVATLIVIAAWNHLKPKPDEPLPPIKQTQQQPTPAPPGGKASSSVQGTVLESPKPKLTSLDMKTVTNSNFKFSVRVPQNSVRGKVGLPNEIDAYEDEAGKFLLVVSLIKMGNNFSFSKLSPELFEKFKAEFKEEMAYRYDKAKGMKAEFLDEGIFSMNGQTFLWLKAALHKGTDSIDMFIYATVNQGNLFIFDYCSNSTVNHTPSDYILTSLNSLRFN